MSSDLTLKRRRVSEAHKILRKPFISPFKTPRTSHAPLQQKKDATAELRITGSNSVTKTTSQTHPKRLHTTISSSDLKAPNAQSTPVRRLPRSTHTSQTTDPAEVAARRALTAIELQIRALRNEIDTLNQAARLMSSKTDANLESLTQKWKVASQAAADELYEAVKDRVDHMGGFAAWRTGEQQNRGQDAWLEQSNERQANGVEDSGFDSDGHELSEERLRKEEGEQIGSSPEEWDGGARLEGTTSGGDDGDDTTFTMATMLRSLRIEYEVIGYDKVTESWLP